MQDEKTDADLGLDTVAFLRERYQVEDQWIELRERGFRWWPAELEQEVWAEPAWDDDGIVVWRVHVRTDLLCDVDPAGRAVEWVATVARSMGSLSAPILDGQDAPRVRLASSVYVHEQNLCWTQPLLAWVGLLQLAEARLWAAIAEETGVARARWSAHPVTGPRREPDELTGLVEKLVLPRGRGPSPYAGSDMEACLRFARQPPVVLATGGPEGVTAELPFGPRTSLLQLRADARHPLLGSGLLVLLTLPVSARDGAQAVGLNSRELQAGVRTKLMGSWVPDETGLSFAAFYPSAVRREGIAVNLFLGMAQRALWAAESVRAASRPDPRRLRGAARRPPRSPGS